MMPPGFNPLKDRMPHDPHPRDINFVRHDITKMLTSTQEEEDVESALEILNWCQESFPDDSRALEFQKGQTGDVDVNRMTLDLADLER